MTHNYKYSLGVYVNRNMFSAGGEGMPHVFLGLKIEYTLINANFNGVLDEKVRKKYAIKKELN